MRIRMDKKITHIFLSVLLLGLSVSVNLLHAEDLQVCVDSYPPFKIVDSSGKVTGGIDVELIDKLTTAMGINAVYTYSPWARCLRNLKHGHSDLVSGITKKLEREEFLHYIEPPYKTKSVKVFYINKGDEDRFRTYEDFHGAVVGVLRGARYFGKFDNDSDIIKYELSDELSGFRMLQLRRLDAFIITEEVGDYIIEKNGYRDVFSKSKYTYNQKVEVYFALSKKSSLAERLPDFFKITKELKDSGAFDGKYGL